MYASLAIFIAVPGNNEQMEKIAERGPASLKGMRGFKSATYFSDKSRNEYGLMTIWETKDDFDAFMEWGRTHQMGPWFAGTLFENRAYYVNNFVLSG